MKLSDEHIARAYFVGGIGSYFRSKADPFVGVALDAAKDFLDQLPQDVSSPHVTGGGVGTEDKILTFFWIAGRCNTIHDITATIKDNGLWDLDIDLSGVKKETLKDASLSKVLNTINASDALWPFKLAGSQPRLNQN